MKLTAASARDLQAPGTIKDHIVRGLELRAKARGKYWFYYYRAPGGEQRRPKIGAYPAISVDAARDLARELAVKVAQGLDPSKARTDYRASPTVADLLAVYIAEHATVYKSQGAAEADERNARNHVLPVIGHLKVSEVQLSHINDVTQALGKAGKPVMANRVRALLRKMFNVAIYQKRWILTGINPAGKGALSFPEFKRRRKVEPSEFEALSKALDALERAEPRNVAAIRCILLAGARITELATAPRSALARGIVSLQEHKTAATGDTREIYLPGQALAVIEALPDDGSGRLFGAGVDRFTVYRVWQKALEAAGLDTAGKGRLRPQDLRRTFASLGISKSGDLDDIGELFGHKNVQTTRGYAWLYEDAKRLKVQEVADKVSGLMRPET